MINKKEMQVCEHWDIDGEWSCAKNEHVPVSQLMDLIHNNGAASMRIVGSSSIGAREEEEDDGDDARVTNDNNCTVICDVINAMYSLQSPQSSPWKFPLARFLSTISLDEADNRHLDVTYYVYASRLLFELIANPSIHVLMQHLEAVGSVSGPIPIPRKKNVLYLSPEPQEMCPFSLSSLLRHSESTGYGYVAAVAAESSHLKGRRGGGGDDQQVVGNNWVPPSPPISKNLTPKLLEFQRESLAWMMDQESNAVGINCHFWQSREFVDGGPPLYYFPLAGEFRLEKPPVVTGGLLCSEMGLGKTVMCIALALNDANKGRPSLIVAPVTLCGQWISEIVRHTSNGALPAMKWTGSRVGAVPLDKAVHAETGVPLATWLRERGPDWRARSFWSGCESILCKVVLGSLVSPQSNYRRWWPPALMEPQPWCDLEFCGKVSMHHSHLYRTQEELEEHFMNGWSSAGEPLLCSISFNSTDILGEKRLGVVVTSYDSLRRHRADFRRINWHRLFLDECQEIKRPTTVIAKSVQCIEATHRWMISGTPLSNSLRDLHGELGFLRVWPFSLVNDGFYEQKLQWPLKCKDPSVLPLLHALIEATMFRHSKSQRYRIDNRPLVSLPPYTIKLRPVQVPETSSENYVHHYLELLARSVCLHIMGGGGEGPGGITIRNIYSKLIFVLNTIRKALTHTRLTQLVEIDEMKRSVLGPLEIQAAELIVSRSIAGGRKLSNKIVYAPPKMVMDFVQAAGSRVGGLHRDTGREIAVGGEDELKLREKLEGYSVQELRARMDELNMPKPKAWIHTGHYGSIISGSSVMTLLSSAPFQKEEKEQKLKYNFAGEHLRIGSSSGDEVEVKRFESCGNDSTGGFGAGGGSQLTLAREWEREDVKHMPVFRHTLAMRKKPYIDMLLMREKEMGVLLSSGFKAIIDIISGGSAECAICLNAIKQPVVTKCTHVFCRPCIGVALDNAAAAAAASTTRIVSGSSCIRCPLCRTPLSVQDMMEMAENVEDHIREEGECCNANVINAADMDTNPVIVAPAPSAVPSAVYTTQKRKAVQIRQQPRLQFFPTLHRPGGGNHADPRFPSLDSEFISHHNAAVADLRSLKLCALMEDMRASIQVDPDAKFVIFSQFSQSLKEVATVLDAEGQGFGYKHVDGHLDGEARTMAVTEFTCLPAENVRCMLLTTGSAASGLTLTVASEIYLLDVMLSAQDEAQALSRAHRIGQSKPVRCVIYYMASSVESRLVEMRQAEGSLSGNVIDGARAMSGIAENGGEILSLNSIKTLLGVEENELGDPGADE